MQIGYDSPEAFEEVLWRAFWPEKYAASKIGLWSANDAKAEAQAFFQEHMRKIVALRRPDRLADGRYVAKNNANIARLDLLPLMFPGAGILVPFRDPIAHAASLLRQHRNFLELHRNEPFVRRYMADIGHYEFGALHRPIAFAGLEDAIRGRDPLGLDYWLAYWVAAFEHILARRDAVVLVEYEAACADGRAALAAICERFAIPDEGALEAAGKLFKVRSRPDPDSDGLNPGLRDRARELHTALVAAAR